MSIFARSASPAPVAQSAPAPMANAAPAPDPYGVASQASPAQGSGYSPDAYAGSQSAASGVAPMSAPPGKMASLMGSLGLGKIAGMIGGGLLGWKVLLPRIAARVAPKVPPSLFLKFGVIGGAALAGGWLLSKLLGHKAAA
jgi:hypothetical protein